MVALLLLGAVGVLGAACRQAPTLAPSASPTTAPPATNDVTPFQKDTYKTTVEIPGDKGAFIAKEGLFDAP